MQKETDVLDKVQIMPRVEFHLTSQHDECQKGDNDQQKVINQDHWYDIVSPYALHSVKTIQNDDVKLPEFSQFSRERALLWKLGLIENHDQFVWWG